MYIFKIVILYLVAIHHSYGQTRDGADATSTDVGIGCFSGDSSVMLTNGKQKQISYLQTGDEILAVDHLKIIPTEMVFMLDKQRSKQAKFYTFITDSGHQISLTGLHLIPIISSNNKMNYIAARQVQLDDQLYVRMSGHMKSSAVRNITIEIKKGYFAPLTLTARFISVNEPFNNNRTDGIHWLVQFIYQMITYIQPSTLQIL
ncbi:unnamed protein product [Rotaria sordida]|uniref:Hint domain-containing protein n=1 Tax=Rotaria sordida TaxID=392033 RepID=A0A815INM5_9BILA|nr:unnamed protein product [Rotaria sordida]